MKTFLLRVLTGLTMLLSMQQPIPAAEQAVQNDRLINQKSQNQKHRFPLFDCLSKGHELRSKKHHSSSSSHDSKQHQKKKKGCCKKSVKLLKKINQTTQQDLAMDQEILGIVSQFGCVTVMPPLKMQRDIPGDNQVVLRAGIS